MRIGVRLLSGVIGVFLVGGVHSHNVWGQNARSTIATEADFAGHEGTLELGPLGNRMNWASPT